MKERGIIRVCGKVQDVGFQHLIKQASNHIGVTGIMKKYDNGSVNIICEGERQDIELLMGHIRNLEGIMELSGIEIEYTYATGEYSTFEIVPEDVQLEILSMMRVSTAVMMDMAKDVKTIARNTSTIIDQGETMIKQNHILIDCANHHTKQNSAIDKQGQIILKQNDTIIGYASHHTKQNDVIIKQNE